MGTSDVTRGFADLHVHQFANLAFGGRVLWGDATEPVARSLEPCGSVHGRHGMRDWAGNVGRAVFAGVGWRALMGHDNRGFPSFVGWPSWDDFTHQLAHVECLRRAVDGGLRLIVMLAVHNELLCRLTHRLRLTSDDMDAVDRQLQAAKDLQDRIDASCGGPGTGWYRIVSSPAEARAVITSGRLAVVLGIEVDNIFGGYADTGLTEQQLSSSIEKYYQAGVRHVIPLHFCDNAFGGSAFALPLHWSRTGGLISRVNPVPTLPVYRMNTVPGAASGYRYRSGHCNERGLTSLGHHLIGEMMNRGMLIDVDHMSARTRSEVLTLAEAADFPVVAGHTEFQEISRPELCSERQLRRWELDQIYDLGGAVAPLLRQPTVKEESPAQRGTASSFLRAYNHALRAYEHALSDNGQAWVGLGSDINGFAALPGPVPTGSALVEYPFEVAVGGQRMDRSILGDRVFDINRDGVAHIGMLPDFMAALTAADRSADLEPLMRSAMGYVNLWERALRGRAVP